MEAADNAVAATGVSGTSRATGCVGATTLRVGTGEGNDTVGVITTTEGTVDTVGVIVLVGSAGVTADALVGITGTRVAVLTMTGVIPTGWVGGTNVTVDLSFSSVVGAGIVFVGTEPLCRTPLCSGDAQAAVP